MIDALPPPAIIIKGDRVLSVFVKIKDLNGTPTPPNPVRIMGKVVPGAPYSDKATVWDGTGHVTVNCPKPLPFGLMLYAEGEYYQGVLEPTVIKTYDKGASAIWEWSQGPDKPDIPKPVIVWGKVIVPTPATVRGSVSFTAKPIVASVTTSCETCWTTTTERITGWVLDTETVELTITEGGRNWSGTFERKKD